MSSVNPDIIYRIRGLHKDYGEKRVLEIGSLDIYRGEIFALVGPSGSGKSTLLRLLNFLEEPTAGEIHFEGNVFKPGMEMPLQIRRQVTTVFQQPLLLDRSVWDNVAFGLRLRGWRDGKDVVQEALNDVGLQGFERQRARTLSGGEAQRVALARAVVLKPTVLLMDEPTANLDPYNVGIIERIARRLNEEQGATLVLVTHNVFQARRLAKRVAFLLEGKIVEVNETERFFDEPQDSRTAAFVRGDMVY